ncbi:hypothetical protein PCANC_09549 [Puccinia coronata f. sp. avenae]|uniref:Uncharacterized protein n=1 Tax=Puccinia coronata f. sp. avenae TaxID=200324 RepID=A0A2N5V4Y3_9BASI|nr:hypothetical protein PCASD_21759 [Puccinia coronata f. sp. avenae]PLW45059.1 hypothetical protein PCANC_09549 [Puccinia coronata f. sp. avenae]
MNPSHQHGRHVRGLMTAAGRETSAIRMLARLCHSSAFGKGHHHLELPDINSALKPSNQTNPHPLALFPLHVCSAWGSHINRHQELYPRGLPLSGEFYTSVLQKRGDDAPKGPAKPAGDTAKSEGGASDTADDVKEEEAPAKPTDKTTGTSGESASKAPPPKGKTDATPAPTSGAKDEANVKTDQGTSPPNANPQTVDVANLKEKLTQHRKNFDDFIGKLRKKVDGRIEKLQQDQKKGGASDSNPTPPPS